MVELAVQVGGLALNNPLILASGVLGVSPSTMVRLAELGIGAVTTKSVGPVDRIGNPNPSVIALGGGTLLNCVGLANPGIDAFVEEIHELKERCKCPVIVSVFGQDAAQYAEIAGKAADAGADAIELNVSCPHAEVSVIGGSPSHTAEVVAAAVAQVNVPVWVKLSPNVTDLPAVGKAAEDAGAAALVAINTVRAMAIDIQTGRPFMSAVMGGLSGPAIKPVGIRAVFELTRAVEIPVVGLGGVTSAEDVLEYMMAGATAIGAGSVFVQGMFIVRKLLAGVTKLLGARGVTDINEIRGLTHRVLAEQGGV
jgi:dihydroorotate dehydrogenase (NAD+) catalytic subunit